MQPIGTWSSGCRGSRRILGTEVPGLAGGGPGPGLGGHAGYRGRRDLTPWLVAPGAATLLQLQVRRPRPSRAGLRLLGLEVRGRSFLECWDPACLSAEAGRSPFFVFYILCQLVIGGPPFTAGRLRETEAWKPPVSPAGPEGAAPMSGRRLPPLGRRGALECGGGSLGGDPLG